MHRPPADFSSGVRDALPLQVGLVPYGFIVGLTAVRLGLTPPEAFGFAAATFAGAAQLAAMNLLAAHVPLLVVVFTAAVVNLRVLMYSASIAPYLQSYRFREKALFASVLVGMSYAHSIAEFQRDDSLDHGWYVFGVSLSLYVVWVGSGLAGIALGGRIPDGLDLTFAVPLVFLALAFSSFRDRPTIAAGLSGGAVAVLSSSLPMRLNLVVAGLFGVGVGLLIDRLGGDPA
ncbi:MAG: AzlC family ABC transporter permease [Salinigranum sp.]